jgi:DNA-directed RNA polymerase specialized sigma24 family protein
LDSCGTPASDDEQLFVELYPSLRRFASVVKPPEVDADDLVQEAVVRALGLGPLCEHENPGAYLRRAIVNVAANHRRGLGRRRRAWSRLVPAIEHGASYPSDLEDLGCTETAGRARVSRALRKLRVDLEEEVRDV